MNFASCYDCNFIRRNRYVTCSALFFEPLNNQIFCCVFVIQEQHWFFIIGRKWSRCVIGLFIFISIRENISCIFFKWIFKTFVAVMILSNTFNIVMAVFDVSQQVIQQSAGLIQGSTAVTPDVLNDMQTQLEAMELGPLLGIFLQSFFVQFTMTALNIVIFVIVYGRMIEIYLMTSLAPIPFATSVNREVGHMGHNYFKSLFAVGFQGMLIMVCVAIYAVLVQSIATDGDMMNAIWTCVGYTVLLCFVLFKTGSLSKSIFGAH